MVIGWVGLFGKHPGGITIQEFENLAKVNLNPYSGYNMHIGRAQFSSGDRINQLHLMLLYINMGVSVNI